MTGSNDGDDDQDEKGEAEEVATQSQNIYKNTY